MLLHLQCYPTKQQQLNFQSPVQDLFKNSSQVFNIRKPFPQVIFSEKQWSRRNNAMLMTG